MRSAYPHQSWEPQREKLRGFSPKNRQFWTHVKSGQASWPCWQSWFFFRKVEPMRTKPQPGARNFAAVIFYGGLSEIVPFWRDTKAKLGEKKARGFEAVTLIIDKYQQLNGTSPAFFLEPERHKGTN
jgi:hypothetical protein